MREGRRRRAGLCTLKGFVHERRLRRRDMGKPGRPTVPPGALRALLCYERRQFRVPFRVRLVRSALGAAWRNHEAADRASTLPQEPARETVWRSVPAGAKRLIQNERSRPPSFTLRESTEATLLRGSPVLPGHRGRGIRMAQVLDRLVLLLTPTLKSELRLGKWKHRNYMR